MSSSRVDVHLGTVARRVLHEEFGRHPERGSHPFGHRCRQQLGARVVRGGASRDAAEVSMARVSAAVDVGLRQRR